MKGFGHRGPHYPSILEAFNHVITTTARQGTPQFRPSFIFEYFPLSKINSVPNGTTAFLRIGESNGIILVPWTPAVAPGTPEALDLGEVEEGNTGEGRAVAKELEEILLRGQNHRASRGEELGLGYLNYGAFVGGFTLQSFSSGPFSSFFMLDPDAANRADKAGVAFGENYQRLREIKRVYDPEGVFNKWFPIPPA